MWNKCWRRCFRGLLLIAVCVPMIKENVICILSIFTRPQTETFMMLRCYLYILSSHLFSHSCPLFLLLVTIGSITSAQGIKEEISLKYGATNEGKRQDPAMQKFRDNRLGAFIHWGLYAIPGGEWNGKMYVFFIISHINFFS